jgi:polyphosphate glucokinase
MKGALVDLETGDVVGERVEIKTPQPAVPDSMAKAVAAIVKGFDYEGPIGIGFPSVVDDGVVLTAMNIDTEWLGVDARALFAEVTGARTAIANDADCAALCEGRYGVARGVGGLVIVTTFGTGIGSGFLFDGELIPNVELGAMELEGHVPAESYFSAKSRRRENLTWNEWGSRINLFLTHVVRVFTPELVVVGGGVVRFFDEWGPYVDPSLPVVGASRANNAGIVGAASLAD